MKESIVGVAAYPGDTLRRVQLVQVEILKAIAELCDEFGFEWFVDGGTCLGAVRHKGFIPWDDDIDIGMSWEDYCAFCKVAPRVLEGTEYGLYTHASTPNYPPLFAKVYKKNTRFIGEQMMDAGFEEGIFVDVFAYARLDSDKKIASRQARSLTFWQRVSYLHEIAHPYITGGKALKAVGGAAAVVAHHATRVFFSADSIEANFTKVLSQGNGQGEWVNIFYAYLGMLPVDSLFPTKSLTFEDMEVPVPYDTDTYLTVFYGDYMTFPPEDQRCMKPPIILDFGDGVNVIE